MSTLKKALVLSREVANRLSVRFGTTRLVREGFDASGNPTINIDDGTPATTEQNILIRIIERPSIGLNSVGLTQDSYGPHIAQVVMEATAASADVALVTEANKLKVIGTLVQFAPAVEVYVRANGGAPVVADIVAGNLKDTFQDLYFPMMNDS